MKKATKGALAAAAAGTLMVGGAGSLAYWTGSTTISGANISSGKISIGQTPDCTSSGLHDWQLSGSALGTQKIVPGDSVTKICSFAVTMEGKNVKADLAISTPSFGTSPNALAAKLLQNTTTSFTVTPAGTGVVSGTNNETITGADVYTVTATVTVDFPFDALTPDNGTPGSTTQGLGAALAALTLSATQVATS